MLCYVRGVHTLFAKRLHDSVEIRPYCFRLSWRLICIQDCVLSSKSVLMTYLDRYTWGVFLDLDGSSGGVKWGILFWFTCHHSSDLLSSKDDFWLSEYIHWVVAHEIIEYGSKWGCILQLQRFQIHDYLKHLQ